MNLSEAILEKLKALPPEKQQEVLDFAEFLKQKMMAARPAPPIPPEQRAKNWETWAESHPKNSPGLPDVALRRENIYD